MKLLESYSNNASVNIKTKPFLYQKFYPLGNIDKYITLQNSSGMSAKNYSYYQEVIDLLFPILEKNGIKIILLGDKDTPPLNKVINLCGQTTIHQSAYIVKRALAHLGNDSWLCHFCGAEEVSLVALYGSTTVENHSPYHFNPDITIFLESHRNGNKASYQREESPKTIDLILPEEICAAVCKLLNLDFSFPYKTLSIGRNYNSKIIESTCDAIINTQQLGLPNLIMRLDLNFNLAILVQQLNISKCSIITDRPIPSEILSNYRQNIIEVCYEIDKNHNPNFCKELQANKIPYRNFSKLPPEELNRIKLDYLDFNLIHSKLPEKPEFLKDKDLSKIFYKSSKLTLSSKGVFQSHMDYFNNRPIKSLESEFQLLSIQNLDNLWYETEYCYFAGKI